jgi:predicted nucleic acid-binding protein
MISRSSATAIPAVQPSFDPVAGYLLDTNVISETRKIRAGPRVLTFLEAADAAALFLSVLTLGELRKGVAASDPAEADQLGLWVDGIETICADRVLPVDISVARIWGECPLAAASLSSTR